MSLLYLVWRNLTRKKVRTLLTLLSIFVIFALFGVLSAVQSAFSVGIDLAGQERLVTQHKVSLIQPLPISYQGRIVTDEGVERVSYANWFGGIYKDRRNQFSQFAVEAESYLDIYPEILLEDEQRAAFMANRTGAIVGRKLAERFDWSVGDRIPIQGTIYRPQDGSNWEFTIEGIYDGAETNTDVSTLLFHYDYLKEAMGSNFGMVGFYIIRINDPDNAAMIAERIDQRFANSPAETRTSTENAFIQNFANQTGNIAAIVTGIVAVAFFTLLLVAGNTMAQAVRERTGELAVLKTLGFSDGQMLGMVFAESMLLAMLGGFTGLVSMWWLTHNRDLGGGFLPNMVMSERALVTGVVLALGLGLVTGAIPAVKAMRLQIVDALRKGG